MIKHLRLINGDEIIGDVHNHLDLTVPTVDVENPLMVQERQTERGTTAIVLLRYIPFALNKTITLQRSHIIATTELHPSIKKYYHNSLTVNGEFEKDMIASIDQANEMMEQQERSPTSFHLIRDDVDDTTPVIIHKGTNTKQ
jgi:hypothetical protein